jgi:hypothetical protein
VTPDLERWSRFIAVAGAVGFVGLGLWAFADPESFYDQVATFEPYNQHFIQDIGAFMIGLGAVLALAVAVPRLDALTVALLGTGIGSGIHFVSHLIGHDLGGRPGSDIPLFGVLAVVLIVPGVLRWRETVRTASPRRSSRTAPPGGSSRRGAWRRRRR